MTSQTRATLYTYFETGDFPTQQQFANLIDSCLNLSTTSGQSITSDISANNLDINGILTIKGSAVANFTGNLAVGGNLTVSANSIVAGSQTAGSLIPTGATVPTNGLYLQSVSAVALSNLGKQIITFNGQANAVNNILITNSNTGNDILLRSTGSDISPNLVVGAQGAGSIFFASNSGVAKQFEVLNVSTPTNWIGVVGSNGGPPVITMRGASSSTCGLNINLAAGVFQVDGVNANTTGTAANVNVDSSGNLKKSTSSIQYKRDVIDYDKGLQQLLGLRPVYYKSKQESDGNRQYAGLIAEDVDGAGMGEFVLYQNNKPDGLAYGNMAALLINAIKDLQKQINDLKGS